MKKLILGLVTSTMALSSPICALAMEDSTNQEMMDEIMYEAYTSRVGYTFKVQFVEGKQFVGSPITVYKNEEIAASLIAWIPNGYHFADRVEKCIPTYDLGAYHGSGIPTFTVPIQKDPAGAGYPPLYVPYEGEYPIVVRGKTKDGETHVVYFDDLSNAPIYADGYPYISGAMINDKFKRNNEPYRVAENVKVRYVQDTERTSCSVPSNPNEMLWAGLRNRNVLTLEVENRYTSNPAASLEEESEEVFRLFNPATMAHLYTKDKAEKESLVTSGQWNDEGQAWIAPTSSSSPVYRLFNPNSGEHHYTIDKNEYDTLVSYGWTGQNTAFFSADNAEKKVALYRLYNSKAPQAAQHHYTIDEEERDNLIKEGWNLEGTAWYGLSLQ